jgi:flavodoxin
MKKVIIIYGSRTGNTEKMANYIAEGARFSGNEVVLKKVTEIKKEDQLTGYDAYIFGSPTYHKDIIGTMKQFLFLAQRAGLEGKLGGAFGSSTHSGEAPGMIFDTIQYVLKMNITDLGPLKLKEDMIETQEGLKACQQYGKAIGDQLN